jgi:predicted MFS family arabinose efflux permease
MTSAPAATSSVPRLHYGWVVAGATFLSGLIMAGAVGAPGIFIIPLQQEFGWSTSDISAALAVRFFLFGIMAPFAAALMNKYGIRRIVLIAQTIVVICLTASIWMTSLWQLLLLWGVGVGIGTGMTALVLGATVATRWFVARRGLVVGILTASVATGQLVFLPLLTSLAVSYGWRVALMVVCVAVGCAAVVMLVLMRDRPSDVGLLPYGHEGPPPIVPPAPTSVTASAFGALRDAAKTRAFWVLFGTFFVCGASTNGLIQTHFIPMCVDFGLSQTNAAGLLAAIGIFDFIGTIASGWLADRYDNRWLLFWYYGLRGLSLVFLPFTNFTFFGLSIFAVFYGLDWIATVPPTVRLTVQKFGADRANVVFGWIFAGHQIGAAMAAFAAGFSRTMLATYLPGRCASSPRSSC